MYRDKYTIGNVCLVVFLAFIFSVFTALWRVEPAAAAPIYMDPALSDQDSTFAPNDLRIRLTLKPTTPTDFGSLNYYVTLLPQVGDVPIIGPTQFNLSAHQTVYGVPYASLLDLVYTGPTNFTLAPTFRVVYSAIYTDMVSNSVYLTLRYKPPEAPPAPSPAPPPVGTAPTTVGDVTVTSTTAQLAVNPQQLTEYMRVLPPEQPLVMPVSTNLIRREMAYELPAAALTAVGTREVIFPGDNVQMAVPIADVPPPATIPVEGATLRVELVRQDPGLPGLSFGEVFGTDTAAQFEALTPSYRLEMAWVGPQGQRESVAFSPEEYRRPMAVVIPFDPARVGDLSRVAGVQKDREGNVSTVASTVVSVQNGQGLATIYINHLSHYSLAKWNRDFTDTAAHWAYETLVMMGARSVARGYPDGSFVPDGRVTRGEFAALLLRALGRQTIAPEVASFSDVEPWMWHYRAIETCVKLGLVTGYEDGSFRPDAQISRQEMAAMIVRAMTLVRTAPVLTAGEADELLGKFVDASGIGGWAVEPVAKAVKTGIVLGRTETTFEPTGEATRAEAVVMLKRLLEHNGHI